MFSEHSKAPLEVGEQRITRNTARIGIVGTGHVGPQTASALIQEGIVDELLLCNTIAAKVRAEAPDLYDAPLFAPHPVRITDCGHRYEELVSCGSIINSAGYVKLAAG